MSKTPKYVPMGKPAWAEPDKPASQPDPSPPTPDVEQAIGMLRQWLNEERIRYGKQVTNEELHHWLAKAFDQERQKAEAAVRLKSYEAIHTIHMAHDWNGMSQDLLLWLSVELHDIQRLKAQLGGGDK